MQDKIKGIIGESLKMQTPFLRAMLVGKRFLVAGIIVLVAALIVGRIFGRENSILDFTGILFFGLVVILLGGLFWGIGELGYQYIDRKMELKIQTVKVNYGETED